MSRAGADVALISPYPEPGQPSETGVAWYTQGLARALARAGAAVTVVAPGRDGSVGRVETDGGVRVERCFTRTPVGPVRAARVAVATGAPVTHVQHEAFLYGGPDTVPGMLVALRRLKGRARGPVVTMHQVVAPQTIDRSFTGMHRVAVPPAVARTGLATLQSSISRLASRVIVHEDAFQRVLPGSVVLPLGANHSEAPRSADGARARQLRARVGAAEDTLLVLAFGFVAPYKGLEPLLDAAGLAGPRVKVVVAGAEHPRLVGQGYLRQLQERYGRTATFTGYVEDHEVEGWFSAADAVALNYPKPFSSSGVLAQAANHGVAALLSPALAAIVGFPGGVALPPDPPDMARRLDSLAGDRPALDELKARTKALGTGRSWPEVAERHLAIYEEVIDAQRSPGRPVRLRPSR